jgi:hypothetical protein
VVTACLVAEFLEALGLREVTVVPPARFGASMQQLRLRAARRAAFACALSVFLSAMEPPTAGARWPPAWLSVMKEHVRKP